ncbi:MAG: DNA mismatch repair protein, partial [Chryseobacterium sp.]
SIYSIYNNTATRGGAEILEKMFLYPLSDVAAINDRSNTLQFFAKLNIKFPFRTAHLDSAETYLGMTDKRTKLSHQDDSLSRKFSNLLSTDGDYKSIYNGIKAAIGILQSMEQFISVISSSAPPTSYLLALEKIAEITADQELKPLLIVNEEQKLSYATAVDYDDLIRFRSYAKIKELLLYIYHLDVFITVAEVASKYDYVFPEALDGNEHTVRLTDVYHPLVKNAIANSLTISPASNVIFLTGANMAGKSTLMKSLGIALYLAHMGFPVAASKMEFSVRNGIYTTINLPDDLNSGNSHFYAEVLRVKKIAKELGVAKNLFIIFDELFRGTNVKDAFEGTVAITQGFAKKRNCMFVVSTHIIEAGEVLRARCQNINFVYLPTEMDQNKPVYTYQLKAGITADRHGMVIINNEGILEIIKSRKHKNIAQ